MARSLEGPTKKENEGKLGPARGKAGGGCERNRIVDEEGEAEQAPPGRTCPPDWLVRNPIALFS